MLPPGGAQWATRAGKGCTIFASWGLRSFSIADIAMA